MSLFGLFKSAEQKFLEEITKIHPDRMMGEDRMRNDKGRFSKLGNGGCLFISKDEYYAGGGQTGFYVNQMGIDLKVKGEDGVPHFITIDIQAGRHREHNELDLFAIKILHNGQIEIDEKLKGDKVEGLFEAIYDLKMPLEEAAYHPLMRHDAFYPLRDVYLNSVLSEDSRENIELFENDFILLEQNDEHMQLAQVVFEHLQKNPGTDFICGEVHYDEKGELSHLEVNGKEVINLGRHTGDKMPPKGEENSHK